MLCSCQTAALGDETKKYILVNFSVKRTCHRFRCSLELGEWQERVLPVVFTLPHFLSFPQKSSPRCPVIGRGQTMKVRVPAAVVQMPIRGIHLHPNPKSKKNENPLPPSRRRTPNYPAKLLLSYLLVLKGKADSKTFRSIFARYFEAWCLHCTFQGRGGSSCKAGWKAESTNFCSTGACQAVSSLIQVLLR